MKVISKSKFKNLLASANVHYIRNTMSHKIESYNNKLGCWEWTAESQGRHRKMSILKRAPGFESSQLVVSAATCTSRLAYSPALQEMHGTGKPTRVTQPKEAELVGLLPVNHRGRPKLK